ncbi:MFS transporter [Nocardioides rotundus]|uniref:MFS transporter n=1 Tax=Nocardioides rotundus TaxID=1774216 RepID=UPI001CBB7C20|nr:MFS transporter [Nocardioides rotundus]UAL28969.1 MFS transporter [Nocardioides rotundus]
MTETLSPAAARRVFLLLTLTRWFPVGIVGSLIILWALEQGLPISLALLAFSAQGFVTLLLELPTSGFADAFGRRAVFLASGVVNVVAAAVMVLADSLATFAVAAALQGVYRALDSGPLEAWYVDTLHVTEPDADPDGTLAAQGTVVGLSIAAGALLSGALVAWNPLHLDSALELPMWTWVVLAVIHLIAIAVLLKEPPVGTGAGWARARQSVREAPQVVREGIGLLARNRVLLALVLVEVFWSVGMVTFESFMPVRLAELVGGEERAGALMGPVSAGGWAVFALGSALAGLTSRRLGATRTAMLARVLNGLGAVAMGLAAGPVALIVAYLVTYGLHGSAGPVHATLLHREATRRNRATVLSMNSMVAFAAFAVAGPLLGFLATGVSTQVAMVTAGAFSILGVLCYLPALHAERARAQSPAPSAS